MKKMSPRKIAIKKGDLTYEGSPCKEGHTTRSINNGCIICSKRLSIIYHAKYDKTPERKKFRNERDKLRVKNDPVFGMKERLRAQLRRWCKQVGNSKKGNKTHELLGYTAKELKTHIESLFQGPSKDHPEGMTWENRDEWDIDHVKPQSHFTSINQMKECFALSNLKPEWGEWNRSKGNRFVGSSEDYPLAKKAA